MNAAESPVRPGDLLVGKYRVERVIGVGGMGVVVAVTHLDLLELRAVKFMLPAGAADADAVERFLREARAAALLKSEHVARVYDVGRLENGAPFMVMEYLEGSDLSQALKRTGPLPVDEAVLYVLQAAEALAEAHGRGIVHRDLKPANLFLTLRPDGTPSVKVLDFGISKILGAHDHDITHTDTLLGSPNYMSPEQMQSTRDVDSRSDLWSLGVILYQLLTRELPFRGRGITEIVAAVLQGGFRLPSAIRPELAGFDSIVLRCLERDPARRYADVGELARALAPFLPAAAPLVDSISRLVASPSRSAVGLPMAVLSESQKLAFTPRPSPATPVIPASAMSSPPPSGVSGSSTAWGGTSSGSSPRRSRALLVGTAVVAMLVGGLFAFGIAHTALTPPNAAVAGAAATALPTGASKGTSVAPSVQVSIAPASASPAVIASVASSFPSPSASASATASAGHRAPPPRAPDPFGMDRK